jgi:formylglycine-generating enzyme required for sulfatase activity
MNKNEHLPNPLNARASRTGFSASRAHPTISAGTYASPTGGMDEIRKQKGRGCAATGPLALAAILGLARIFSPIVVALATAGLIVTESYADPAMARIPAGSFTMGDPFSEGGSILHTVYVSEFYMEKFEVTKALWDDVFLWATTNGYDFHYRGSAEAPNHPVQTINWFDMVKWLDARSEKEGRTPAYYTDLAQTIVYRTGEIHIQNNSVKWSAGYRLPTEAEWEKAARGGTDGHRFPWTDAETISHTRANYCSTNFNLYVYDVSPTRGFHPAFNDGVFPYTSPVGSFAPNAFGIFDLAGNVYEACWDWVGEDPIGDTSDPHGPPSPAPSLVSRVNRGGYWGSEASGNRVAENRGGDGPYLGNWASGFRAVLPPGILPPVLTVPTDRTIPELTTLTVTCMASDADLPADTLTFSLVSAPAGVNLDPSSGVLSWTPTEAQGPRSYLITVKVTDNGAPPSSDTKSFTVVVTEANSAPVLIVPPEQTVTELNTLTVMCTASDADLPVNTLTFSLESAPTGVNLDPSSGTLTWTPTEAQGPSTHLITVKVTDNGVPESSDAKSFTVVVTEANSAPVLTVPTDRTVPELSTLTVTNTASDADLPANTLTFSLVSAPAGVNLDATSGVLTWTPTEAQGPSTNLITVKVADNGVPLSSDTKSFTVVVTVTLSNQPPILSITNPTDGATNTAGINLVIEATASDVDGAITNVEFFVGSEKLGEDRTAPYEFPWNLVPEGTHTLTAKATDNFGATITSAPVTITNLPPECPDVQVHVWFSERVLTANIGEEINHELTVDWNGECDAFGVLVVVELAPGLRFVTAYPTNTWYETNGVVTFPLGQVTGTTELKLEVVARAEWPGPQTNRAAVSWLGRLSPEDRADEAVTFVRGSRMDIIRTASKGLKLDLVADDNSAFRIQTATEWLQWSDLTNASGPNCSMPITLNEADRIRIYRAVKQD